MSRQHKNPPFLLVRKGIFEHVRNVWMDEQMYLAYHIILDKCDWGTGVWHGSAASLRAEVGGQWSERTAERVLERLVERRYIDSLFQRGKRGNYDILINNFVPTIGPNLGKKLRPVSAGNPLSADNSNVNPVGSIVQSDDKSAVMAVGASGKVTTEVPTQLPTKVPTQVARIQEGTQETLPSVAVQASSRSPLSLSISEVPQQRVFEEELPE